MKTSPLLLIVVFAFFLAIVGCGDGGIPVNEERARQHIIKVPDAKAYTASLQQGIALLNRRLGDSTLRDSFSIPLAETFNRDAIALLLNQQGADGIRIYFGRNPKNEVCVILVPVDRNGNNIIKNLLGSSTAFIPGVSQAYAQDGGEAIENGQRCPVVCDGSW
jgi:hypothetical protein